MQTIATEILNFLLACRLELFFFFAAIAGYYALFSHKVPVKKCKVSTQSKDSDDDECPAKKQRQPMSRVASEKRMKEAPTALRSTTIAIRAALKQNNFDEARKIFRDFKTKYPTSPDSTPSQAPRLILSQVIELICKEHYLHEFIAELNDVPLDEEALATMLAECQRQQDVALTVEVEAVCRMKQAPLSCRVLSLLLKSFMSGDNGKREHARRLIQEILGRDALQDRELTLAVLGACNSLADVKSATRLREILVKPLHMSIASAFIRFYAEREEYEQTCIVYDQDVVPSCRKDGPALDPRLERTVMTAALRCGRKDLATGFLTSAPADVTKHITMMRNCAMVGDLEGTVRAFETLKQSGTALNSVVYNTVLDACVTCKKIDAAEDWMEKTKEAGMSDIVSYNTLIKAYLSQNNLTKARGVVSTLKRDGLQPNKVTFNELINHTVSRLSLAEVWPLIDEMDAAGVKPNQITCSILLKSLNERSGEQEIKKIIKLVSNMEENMDEVLLSSIVEACVRVKKPDLLSEMLKQIQDCLKSQTSLMTGSHTFGSLIKAYGCARDTDAVWRCWKEMRSRHIRPTSITLGCMVEAVVNNGDTEGAFELVHEMQADEANKDVMNSVIYCSILKGFTREKKFERAWAVYEEMKHCELECSVITYNTLIDACARCRCMERVPIVRADMEKAKIKPNVITYSTMLKGHCLVGEIEIGFKLVKEMKQAGLKPDEIVYNSLLDGCAQHGLVDEGLGVLDQMQDEGVIPSNFTLSVVIKLMGRARRLEKAFSMVEEISKKYNLKLNVHVYTNLAQACISNRALPRALDVFETAINSGVKPENRSYAILVRASMQQGRQDQAVGLIRGALGLPGALPFLAKKSSLAMCVSLDDSLLNETLQGLADSNASELAMQLLSDIKEKRPKSRISLDVQRRVMTNSRGSAPQDSWRTAQDSRRPWSRPERRSA